MIPGDVVLIPLPDIAGVLKLRPALVLADLPGLYQSLLICGISTQMFQIQPNWDEAIQRGNADFAQSGLHQDSAIRLSYLRAASPTEVVRAIGKLDPSRLTRLRTRLADHLRLVLVVEALP
jgi:mRNA interferase MazF